MVVRFMREYVLTENERRGIEKYLKDEKATNLIYVLRHRALKSLKRLKDDVKLLERIMEK